MGFELRDRRWKVKIQVDSTGQAIEFEKLAIEFDCKKTLDPEPNTMQLSVLNLTPDHRRAIESMSLYDPKKVRGAQQPATVGESAQKRPTTVSRAPKVGRIRVELEAGYKAASSLIFRADMRRAISKREGPDVKLELEGEDGGTSILGSRITHSFPPGTERFVVVQELAEALGLGLGNIREVRDKLRFQYRYGTAVNGSAATQLEQVLRAAKLTYSVQNGVLAFHDPKARQETRGLLISAETGMIGSPERDATGALMVTTLLIPDVAPGAYIQLDSRDYSGSYKIRAVQSSGQSHGASWQHVLECWPA
jgi:hypothetical protein